MVFWRHYFAGYGFPWDFVGSYYAAAAYWTEAVRHGGVPMWMPFQSMGYPFLLNLQTGLHYPPMWIFPLLGIPYTLPAAVVLQCLHVFAGALGMYVFARALLRSRREAFLAAFVFQLFGGFYSNAEHVDIVRSFAMLPWLFWAAAPPAPDEARLPRRILAVPARRFSPRRRRLPGQPDRRGVPAGGSRRARSRPEKVPAAGAALGFGSRRLRPPRPRHGGCAPRTRVDLPGGASADTTSRSGSTARR